MLLDYENCKCRKKLVEKLVEKCSENIEEVKMTEMTEDGNKRSSHFTLCYFGCFLYSL